MSSYSNTLNYLISVLNGLTQHEWHVICHLSGPEKDWHVWWLSDNIATLVFDGQSIKLRKYSEKFLLDFHDHNSIREVLMGILGTINNV